MLNSTLIESKHTKCGPEIVSTTSFKGSSLFKTQ